MSSDRMAAALLGTYFIFYALILVAVVAHALHCFCLARSLDLLSRSCCSNQTERVVAGASMLQDYTGLLRAHNYCWGLFTAFPLAVVIPSAVSSMVTVFFRSQHSAFSLVAETTFLIINVVIVTPCALIPCAVVNASASELVYSVNRAAPRLNSDQEFVRVHAALVARILAARGDLECKIAAVPVTFSLIVKLYSLLASVAAFIIRLDLNS
jgi:hypothetical protein